VVAALFDDVTAYLARLHGEAWLAGELTVRYLRPTPVGVPIALRARVAGRTGRRVFTEATATAGGTLIATARCTKVQVDPARAGRASVALPPAPDPV
jgi:acyl-coenzyme A thioesterase PaaI-like protein